MLGGAPELEVGGGDDEEEASGDSQVDDPVGGGGGAEAGLQGDHLRPSVRHVHLGGDLKDGNLELRGREEGERSERESRQDLPRS